MGRFGQKKCTKCEQVIYAYIPDKAEWIECPHCGEMNRTKS